VNIKPYSKNAKKHPDKQLKLIAYSLKRFGWQQPIKVGKDDIIIVGHGRLMAIEKYPDGIKEPWVINEEGKTISGEPEKRKLTNQEEREYRLTDNKIAESEWDMDLAIPELKELAGLGSDIEMLGFDNDLLIDPDEKDDEVPDVPEEATSKLGEIYQLGNHRIMCGDSTKIEDVEKLMDGKKADLAVTDPPYNVNYEGGTGLKIENDNMGDEAFCLFLTEAFKRISESIKLGASFYIWHADSEGYNFRKACKNSGLLIRQCIIWNKNSLVMGRQDYQWKHEPCLYGWKEGSSHNWYGDRNKTTVYKIPEEDTKAFKWFKRQLEIQEKKNTSIVNIDKPNKSSEHPTMKPVELLEKQVINSSKQEDIVLDTFLGSGSTLIACEKTGRICYGMELDPKYIDVIIKRWEDYTNNKAIKWQKEMLQEKEDSEKIPKI